MVSGQTGHGTSTLQTDGRTDGQTDGRLTIAILRFALRVSRGNNNPTSSLFIVGPTQHWDEPASCWIRYSTKRFSAVFQNFFTALGGATGRDFFTG